VVGCRRRSGMLRIEVCDTGAGIPLDQQQKIFGEFYRLGEDNHDRRTGLGLGLAIVERLCNLLNHPIELNSTPGTGSRFAVIAPLIISPPEFAAPPVSPPPITDAFNGKLIIVIDDDALVLESMGGLLRSWNFRAVTVGSFSAALTGLSVQDGPPDFIICDFHMSDGISGIEAIERLRSAFGTPIPAFLISGDIDAERLRETRESGYYLLHKPVSPIALRSLLNQLSKSFDVAGAA
jgi:CheY-like chemotaxis protein